MKKLFGLLLCLTMLLSTSLTAVCDNLDDFSEAERPLSFLGYLKTNTNSGIVLSYAPCATISPKENRAGGQISNLSFDIVYMTVLATGEEYRAVRLYFERSFDTTKYQHQCFLEPDEIDSLIDTLEYAKKYMFSKIDNIDILYRTRGLMTFECSVYHNYTPKLGDEISTRIAISFLQDIPIVDGFTSGESHVWTENITKGGILTYINALREAKKMLEE